MAAHKLCICYKKGTKRLMCCSQLSKSTHQGAHGKNVHCLLSITSAELPGWPCKNAISSMLLGSSWWLQHAPSRCSTP